MSVILVRHADAENESALGDAGRALTPLGRKQAHDTAGWLKAFLRDLPLLVLTSPYMRTVQTGEILVSAWGVSTLESSPEMRPGQTASGAAALARQHASLGLVGHQPMMGELAAELFERAQLPFAFERGAAMVFDRRSDGHLSFRAYRAPFGEVVAKQWS
jgi:phosphohistidine phosphatase